MFDLHTHHDRCGHARGGIREYIEAAIANGLRTIGLSDHSPFFGELVDRALPHVAMGKSEFERYIGEAHALRREYQGRIEVLVGVESDYFPEHAATYRSVYQRYPLDYVIGSVHVLDGVELSNRERWVGLDRRDLKAARERYCDLVARSALSGMFDIIGHVDVIKAVCPEMEKIATPAVDRMMKALADADVVMEINTSGTTKDCGGWYPGPDILERAVRYGVKVTFGSDAHDPYRVGDEYDEVCSQLRALGFRTWHTFSDRRRIDLAI
jgi:histidinol-phosphatase (PHP family)